MQDPHDQTVTLLVIEHGATWPTWGSQIRDRGLNVVVEAQLPHESLEQLTQRVEHRIAREKEGAREIVAAGYVCALPDPEAESTAVRESPRRNASKPDLVPLDPAARERAAFRLALSSRLLEALEMCATASPDHDNSPLSAAGVEVEGALLEGASAEESDCLSKPGQLIIGSGGWRGQPGEPAGRAELMELWSQLSGVVPGKVVSLRFDDAPSSSGAFPAVRPPVNAPADTRSARPSRPDLSSLAAAAGVTGR